MKKHILPLTYAPKIQAVIDGTCTQTIRVGSRINYADLISFHGWVGKPYHSKWSFRTPYWQVVIAWPILIHQAGLSHGVSESIEVWNTPECDSIARADGIVPPTGEELCRVLLSMHTIPENGLEAQIIRWDPTAVAE